MAESMIEWRPVPGYEGEYDVSEQGQVRSHKWGRTRILKGSVNPDGYRFVTLSRGVDDRRIVFVHRLVLLAFVGECPEGMVTRHLNGDPDDNRLSNLSYGTESQNASDRVKHGRDRNVPKTHCPQGHPYSGSNLYVHPKGKRVCRICQRAAKARFELRNGVSVRG